MSEGDRLARAGNYVLGLMSTADRERAERDLEVDPAFRDAVLKIAERMNVINLSPPPDASPADRWRHIAERIGDMPQMRAVAEASSGSLVAGTARPVGQGLHSVPSRRAAVYAISLIAAFAVGYLAALWRM